MFTGYDFMYPVSPSTLTCMYNQGIRAVGRYLTPTSVNAAYFTSAQGYYDYETAVSLALAAQQPIGTPVFFAVDTDVVSDAYWQSQGSPSTMMHLAEVLDYFSGINQAYNDYLDAYTSGSGSGYYDIGVYGGYCTVSEIQGTYGMASASWQTSSWSNGSIYGDNAIYQSEHGVTQCGTNVDVDTVYIFTVYW